MFCLGDGRTVLHDTQVGEIWGDNVDEWPHLIFRRAHQNAKQLIQDGHDPLQLVCDRAHAKGMLLYPTLLVQQGSGERGVDTRPSNSRLENKHLEIGAAGDLELGPGNECLDFMHEEVREERFALIAETLERYEVDGFELIRTEYFDRRIWVSHTTPLHNGQTIIPRASATAFAGTGHLVPLGFWI